MTTREEYEEAASLCRLLSLAYALDFLQVVRRMPGITCLETAKALHPEGAYTAYLQSVASKRAHCFRRAGIVRVEKGKGSKRHYYLESPVVERLLDVLQGVKPYEEDPRTEEEKKADEEVLPQVKGERRMYVLDEAAALALNRNNSDHRTLQRLRGVYDRVRERMQRGEDHEDSE